jgi:hypothetical protein
MTNENLHLSAVALARDYLRSEAALLDVLIQMQRVSGYLEHGCSNLFVYITDVLHLSRAQAYYFCKVGEKSEEVPALKAALDSGSVSLSQARRIIPVLNNDNAAEWIDKAATLKQPILELQVAQLNPRRRVRESLKPVANDICELRCAVTPAFLSAFQEMRDLVSQRMQAPATMADTLEAMKEAFLEKHSPTRRAQRSIVRKTVSSRKQESRVVQGRFALPASVRHQVSLRDRGRCCFRSNSGMQCTQTRWTDIHHLIPVCEGGGNQVENLTTLCSSHHRFVHRHAKSSA